MKKILNVSSAFIDARFGYLSNPRRSLFSLLVTKLVTLVGFLTYYLKTARYRRKALRSLKALTTEYKNKDILVLANGPSVEKLDEGECLAQQAAGSLAVFVVNGFFESPLSTRISPNVFVLSDSQHNPLVYKTNSETRQFWDMALSQKGLRFAVPLDWYPAVNKNSFPISKFLFFDDSGLEGWSKNTNPRYPRGYGSMTAQKALGLSVHSNANCIKLLGFDNSMFMGLVVDEMNQLFEGVPYFYKNSEPQPVPYFRRGVADYFYFISRIFSDYRLFSHYQVFNLDAASLVDAFPKTGKDPLVKGTQKPSVR